MKHWILLTLRIGLGGIFIWAGLTKLMGDPQAFADGIESFRLFPNWMVNGLAIVAPMLELAAGILLLTRWGRLGALLGLVLASVFTGLFAWALIFGIQPNCSCFGAGSFSDFSPVLGLGRAAILWLLSGWLYLKLRVSQPAGTP